MDTEFDREVREMSVIAEPVGCRKSDKYQRMMEKWGRKTITKEQLQELFGAGESEALYPIVTDLEQRGLLEHMPTSGTNGNRCYPIYLKYRIHLPEESFEAEKMEIAALHPVLLRSGYLQRKPAEYRKYRQPLQRLNHTLFTGPDFGVPVSRKERSFALFGQEKMLDDGSFCRLLEHLGLTAQELSFYDTPEYCFNDYIPLRKPRMTLLICENKDIWFNIRRRMFEDQATVLFGTPIDGVLCGWGNRVSERNALTSYTAFLGTAQVTYLYWGDIDRAGLHIYLSTRKNNPGLEIRLFVPAYEEMLRRAQAIPVPHSEDRREIPGDYREVYECLSVQGAAWMQKSIEENLRIPQEIITYADLLEEMR